MTQKLRSVVIVGGGNAGWITAGVLAAKHGPRGVSITLVESPNIAPIGVGEGTWPTMRATLKKMGVSETEFFRHCDAAFKQGAKFAKWTTGAEDDAYYHPLVLPQGFVNVNLAPYWQATGEGRSFADAVCFQEAVCEHGLAPKMLTTPEFQALANYAYHLDAGKFTAFLQKHCVEKLGVTHVLADVGQVNLHENGDIRSVSTQQHGEIEGDLFIDCSGFASLLLGKTLEVPFIDRGDVLFIDRAIAVQVPYESEQDPISTHTISTGQDAGWIWDIGLQSRRGTGYVYSSRHTTEEQAEETLAAYVGPRIKNLSTRKIPIRSGHRSQFWKRNCVAVGLSAGFLEPLEASALVMIELSASMISDQLPASRDVMDIVAKRFNEAFAYRWARVIDFLKLHYVLSQRTDSAFWIDNRDPATVPDDLKDLLTLWKRHFPWRHDFTNTQEVFPSASYQYVLYGMGFRTDADEAVLSPAEWEAAKAETQENRMVTERALSMLPKHRDLIVKIREHGLQRI